MHNNPLMYEDLIEPHESDHTYALTTTFIVID